MEKFKKQIGITLVALIITIVILLILAVVSIGVIRDSKIIAHAQNAASLYNKAKANELDALAKYESILNESIPGEKKEDTGKLRLNSKYMRSGKNNDNYAIFYSDGKVDVSGTTLQYTVNGDEVESMGMKMKLIQEEKNDLMIIEEQNILMATSTDGLKYFNGEKYVNGEEYIILDEEKSEIHLIGSELNSGIEPVLYNERIYCGTVTDQNGDEIEITSTDNGDTIIVGEKVFTKITEVESQTKEYIKDNMKAILKITGEKHEITILRNNSEVFIGPDEEIVFVTSIEDYTIDNGSGDNNLLYVLSKDDNTVQPFAFSADKTKIYMGVANENKNELSISGDYLEETQTKTYYSANPSVTNSYILKITGEKYEISMVDGENVVGPLEITLVPISSTGRSSNAAEVGLSEDELLAVLIDGSVQAIVFSSDLTKIYEVETSSTTIIINLSFSYELETTETE